MNWDLEKGFLKVGQDIINLDQIAHVKWSDDDRILLLVNTVSGHTIKLEAEASMQLYKYLEKLPSSRSAFMTAEEDLPVKLTQALSGATGMPETQAAWPNEVRWDPFRDAYYVTGSHGPYGPNPEEERVLFRKLFFQATEQGKEVFGSAYALEERLQQDSSFKWENHGYLLRLEPRSYVVEPAFNQLTPVLGYMIYGSGVYLGDHLLLSVYTKDESGELVLVPHGEIKIFVD